MMLDLFLLKSADAKIENCVTEIQSVYLRNDLTQSTLHPQMPKAQEALMDLHVKTLFFSKDRYSRGSDYQRHAGSNRGPTRLYELLCQLPLPLQTSFPAVDLGERRPAEHHSTCGDTDSFRRAQQARVVGLSILHCVPPSETQTQM